MAEKLYDVIFQVSLYDGNPRTKDPFGKSVYQDLTYENICKLQRGLGNALTDLGFELLAGTKKMQSENRIRVKSSLRIFKDHPRGPRRNMEISRNNQTYFSMREDGIPMILEKVNEAFTSMGLAVPEID